MFLEPYTPFRRNYDLQQSAPAVILLKIIISKKVYTVPYIRQTPTYLTAGRPLVMRSLVGTGCAPVVQRILKPPMLALCSAHAEVVENREHYFGNYDLQQSDRK